MSTAKKIFICYSHEDEQFKQDLVKHLTWLEQIGIVQEIWSDGKIQPGEPWEKTIQDNLGKCDIAILVVSIDFLTSDFIQGEEFPRLRERRQTDGIHIVPIIARSCPWHDQELLRDLQALPGGDRTLADLSRDAAELDKAYTLITQQLRAIIEESTVQTHSVRIAQARELIARANNELQRDLARSAVTAREALKLLLQDFESSKDKRYIAALRQAISIYQMAMFRQHYSRLLTAIDVEEEQNFVNDLAFDWKMETLVTASDTKGIQIWSPTDEHEEGDVSYQIHKSLSTDDSQFFGVSWDRSRGRVAASTIRKVVIWDAPEAPGVPYDFHGDRVNRVTFSSDGARWASASDDGTVCIVSGDQEKYFKGCRAAVNSVEFHPLEPYIATASWDHTVRLVRVVDGEEPVEKAVDATHASSVNDVAFSNDGKHLASASWDGTTKQWSLEFDGGTVGLTDLQILRGHTRRVNAVAYSSDDTLIATGSWDRTVKVWDSDTGTELFTLTGHAGPVTALAFGPKDRLASASFDGTVRIWDIGRELRLLPLMRPTDRIVASALTQNNDELLLVASDVNGNLRVQAVSVKPPYRLGRIARLEFQTETMLTALALDGHSRTLAAGYADGTLRVWEIPISGGNPGPSSTGRLGEGEGEGINAIAVDPAHKILLVATENGWLSTWDWSNEKLGALESSQTHTGPIYHLTFDVEGIYAASAGWDGQCVKFDVKQPKIDKHSYPANPDPSRPLKFSSVAFDPTSERIATGGLDGTIRIWQLREPQREPRTLPGHLGGVTRMAFDPSGNYLAASGGDGVIRVWSVQRLRGEEMVLEIRDHFEEIIGISFTSDGKFVATASEGGVFLLTGILDGHVVELGRDLLEKRN